MPSSEEILASVTRIANDWMLVAVAWHLAAFVALLAIVSGRWHPSRRTGALLLTLPLLSVSVLAFAGGNPFNALVFLAVASAAAAIAFRLPKEEDARPGPSWATGVGAGMLVLALLYPHFLEGRATWTYLFAAPTGVVPCPTLALVLGFGLLAGGFGSRAWAWLFGTVSLVYGMIGVFRLGVWLDVGLFLGAIALPFAVDAKPVPFPRRTRTRRPA